MKTSKILALSTASFALATGTFAADEKWQVGAGAFRMSEDAIDLDAMYVSFGYRIETSENFFLIPELRIGKGVNEDWGLEIDRFVSVGAKAQYEYDSGLYLFGLASWGDLSVKQGGSADDVGIGVGAGYDFSDKVGAEISWESFDETSIYQLGMKFKF